jgi:hypothetical protein
VAQAQVGASSWYEVKCADGRRYFFNHATQETAWSVPPEVRGVRGVPCLTACTVCVPPFERYKSHQLSSPPAALNPKMFKQNAPQVAAIKQQQADEALRFRQQAEQQRSAAMRQLHTAGRPQQQGVVVGGLALMPPPGMGHGGGAEAFRAMHMRALMAARGQQQAPGVCGGGGGWVGVLWHPAARASRVSADAAPTPAPHTLPVFQRASSLRPVA